MKLTDDKDTGQELVECNRRLMELREEISMFLSQSAEDHVYWVERAGRAQKQLAFERRPGGRGGVFAATAFRRRYVGDHDQRYAGDQSAAKTGAHSQASGLGYFVRRVGAEVATLLQPARRSITSAR